VTHDASLWSGQSEGCRRRGTTASEASLRDLPANGGSAVKKTPRLMPGRSQAHRPR